MCAQEGLELQALVAECAGQVVGVAVVREALELEYLRAHYDLERFLYFEHHRAYEHARLLHFALNPVFQHFTRHFLKVHLPTIWMMMMVFDDGLRITVSTVRVLCVRAGGAAHRTQDVALLPHLPGEHTSRGTSTSFSMCTYSQKQFRSLERAMERTSTSESTVLVLAGAAAELSRDVPE